MAGEAATVRRTNSRPNRGRGCSQADYLLTLQFGYQKNELVLLPMDAGSQVALFARADPQHHCTEI